ncbi:MAG: hypothetical protein FWF49_06010, partial [Oscillospiraceae bacterium]|nr:hypothetical protein [Oscillospiraceae bacterium]
MRRILSLVMAAVLLAAVGLSSGCSKKVPDIVTVAGYSKGDMLKLALQAQADMYANFWDAQAGYITKTGNDGKPIPSNQRETALWHQSMMVFEMYTLYQATGDQTLKDRITAQWEFTKGNFTQAQLIGNFSQAPNIAVDDTGWNAMVLIIYYQVTNDIYALQLAKALIQGGYNYYKDGDTVNGLWYPDYPPSTASGAKIPDKYYKSVYAVGIVSAALEYQILTGDDSLFADSLNVYNWMETNLLRDGDYTLTDINGDVTTFNCTDNLYWCDFNVGRTNKTTEVYGPSGGSRPQSIGEAGSVSGLFGNMGMAVVQARLYQITKDQTYLNA